LGGTLAEPLPRKENMITEEPKTFKEVEALVESGDVSVWLQEERGNKTLFLICDHRRNYEEGEVYEVLV
jgi:hypothetical protein